MGITKAELGHQWFQNILECTVVSLMDCPPSLVNGNLFLKDSPKSYKVIPCVQV